MVKAKARRVEETGRESNLMKGGAVLDAPAKDASPRRWFEEGEGTRRR